MIELTKGKTRGLYGEIAIPWEKIAHMTSVAKNRPHDKPKNRPQDDPKNRPDIINPVPLYGVVGFDVLKALLKAKRLSSWCTRVRILGLLLLLDYICRKMKNGRISISADLAHQFVSKLRKRSNDQIPTEPLLLLCAIGLMRKARPAVCAHVKTPAAYRFTEAYREKRVTIRASLTPKLASKRIFAERRCEKRLNRNYPFRKQLLADLSAVSFLPSARPVIARGFSGNSFPSLRALVSAIDGVRHSVRVSERGQVTTSLGSCPRELHPHLLLHSAPIASCDIANAHWNFLPLILAKRLDFVSNSLGKQGYINEGWREHNRLVALLSDGDFYREWCVDPQDDDERAGKKTLLNILLNSKNEACERNVLYRRIRAEFPITFRIIEDIKRKDHRNLSKQLHRFTADAVEAALLEVQREGIAAIPHVDALVCQEKNRTRVCETLGKHIFEATGVCSAVGNTRYSPLTEIEEQALAFEEIAPGDETMSYDEWEAVRFVKCVAALKLMRRYQPKSVPFTGWKYLWRAGLSGGVYSHL